MVIYDSTAPAGMGEGVYMQARTHEISDEEEMLQAVTYLYGREHRPPRAIVEFQGKYPRRLYKVVPQKIWTNTDGKIKGNYIDKRVEIRL